MKSLRIVELVVISDIHLGTYGCQAKPLLHYLKSIDPQTIILNGDIIDIWQFNKRYWPKSHMKIVKHFLKLIQQGKIVYYLTGNHDEMLRRFVGFGMNNFKILNKKVLELDGKKAWFFHGDVFDVTMQYSKWLTRLGGVGYDVLILLNSFINYILKKIGREKFSLSKHVKNKVKGAVKYINKFEETAVEIAAQNNYKYVVCGHIHHPNVSSFKIKNKTVKYLNSGDWIENLSALEYHNKKWRIHWHQEQNIAEANLENEDEDKSNKELFNEMLAEFNMMKKKA